MSIICCVKTYFRGFVFDLSQGVSTPWDPAEVTATCESWVDQDTGWAIDGIALDSLLVDAEGVATIACRTYHLSAFSASEVAGESGLLSVFGTIPEDLNVLREVSKRGPVMPASSFPKYGRQPSEQIVNLLGGKRQGIARRASEASCMPVS